MRAKNQQNLVREELNFAQDLSPPNAMIYSEECVHSVRRNKKELTPRHRQESLLVYNFMGNVRKLMAKLRVKFGRKKTQD
jgi:hypothetical protein